MNNKKEKKNSHYPVRKEVLAERWRNKKEKVQQVVREGSGKVK